MVSKGKMLKKLFTIVLLAFQLTIFAQESRLADVYYNDGEFEKAATLYKSLYEKNKQIGLYFQRYTECLLSLKAYKEAEDVIKKEIKSNPGDPQLRLSLAMVYDRIGDEEKSKAIYKEVIDEVGNKPENVDIVARSFTSMNMFEQATATYEKATEKSGNPKTYAFSLADLYRRIGNSEKMIHYYLLCAEQFRNNLNYLFDTFDRYLSEEEIEKLQAKLYEVMEKEPDEIIYNEILQWTFINQKDYKKALRQARALDRKLNENGARVNEIAKVAMQDKDYDTAIEGFKYIVDNKSVNSSYYLEAKGLLLDCKRKKVTLNYNYTKEDLISLQTEYKTFLDLYGYNSSTVNLVIEYAELEALYLNDLDVAIGLLKEMVELQSISPEYRAMAKLKLGDYYLMQANQWEATLLYSQVDKDFKEDRLGELARFSNAKLSYYLGDFDWAQEQFDILKSATSKLISNDAIDLSVFIMDNLNLDTTTVPMELFATAELLTFQNKLDEAGMLLDSIAKDYPEHSLLDDILYAKAQIAKKRLQAEEEARLYGLIIEKFPEEIKADNAMFALAQLYELHFKDIEKAKELYLKIFTEYSSSTFAIDARKKYRLLRGDNI